MALKGIGRPSPSDARPREPRHSALVALAVSGPLSLGMIAIGIGMALNPSGATIRPAERPIVNAENEVTSPVPVVTVTATVVISPSATAPVIAPPTTSPTPKRRPQGTVVLDEWHDQSATLTCVNVQTYYDNRSDTAVNTITQSFVTMYTPKHADGQYPSEIDGPVKTLTQTVGIAPYTRKAIFWDVCAPELADKQNPPRADGIDAFESEIGARPDYFTWSWVK